MNIKIITFSYAKNYGGILQSYGLYTYLSRQGHSVDFINYVPDRSNVNNRKKFVELQVNKSKIWGRSNFTRTIWSILFYSSKKKGYELFANFLKSRASFTRVYNSIEELNEDIPEADLYITGSDQVWNTQWSEGVEYPYFLSFVKEKQKKISYASSFGRTYLPDEVKDTVKRLLDDYKAISVRESSGKNILSDLGLDSVVVLDPTLICDKEVWEDLTHEVKERNYILLYQIKYDSNLFKTAKEYADKNKKNLLIISLEKKRDSMKMFGSKVIMPDIEGFLSYVKNADEIITDSFHACVFSVIFHTPFAVYLSSRKEMSSRITDFLELTGLKNRVMDKISQDDMQNIPDMHITWDTVDEKISHCQSASRFWLDNQVAQAGDFKALG